MIRFEYEYCESIKEVEEHIKECEGHHTQQAVFSTFHNALTQICFGCKKIRTNLKMIDNKEKLIWE